MDDGVLCGSPDDLSLALSILEQAGPSVGFHLNCSKSLLFSPDPALPLPSSLADIPSSCEGFVLLGAPVGSLAFRRSVISERVEKIKSLVSLLPSFEDSQVEFSLLRSCLSLPKLLCALRTSSPEVLSPNCCEFDSAMFKALSDLIGGAVSPWARLKATLPVRLGGLGLHQAGIHSSAAFISYIHACGSLISSLSGLSVPSAYTSSALHALCTGLGWAPLSSIDDLNVPVSQKSLSHVIDNLLYEGLDSSAPSPRFRALALSSSLPHAGDWLTVTPSPNLGLHFLGSEFGTCLG